MASFRVGYSRSFCNAGGCCRVCAHFLMTCSSVLTENFLYAENWCKLRQCCLGVSTSTRASVGNQYSCLGVSGNEIGEKSISEVSAFSPTSTSVSAIPASILVIEPVWGSIQAVPESSSG